MVLFFFTVHWVLLCFGVCEVFVYLFGVWFGFVFLLIGFFCLFCWLVDLVLLEFFLGGLEGGLLVWEFFGGFVLGLGFVLVFFPLYLNSFKPPEVRKFCDLLFAN